jgi:hypothetical protein
MKHGRLNLLLIAAFIVFTIFTPANVAATVHTVIPPATTCPSAPCYTSIQSAINAAILGDSISIRPGTYTETVTLDRNIPITGTETARVILSGNGSGPIITVSGVTNTDPTIGIRRLTFINATTGISVIGSSSIIYITNNIFQVGTTGTAVSVDASSTVNIINNTFYQNGTAISRNTDITIKNNIFSTNSLAISAPSTASTLITFNTFFANITDGPTGSNAVTALDPLFVAVNALDFHLKQGSPNPCVDAGDSGAQYNDSFNGTRNDIGAYGGPSSDTIPFQISQPSGSVASPTSISLSWPANLSYLVTNTVTPGSYNVYYSLNVSGAPYQNIANVVSPSTSTTLAGLTPTIPTPPVPTITSTSPLNNALAIAWTQSAGATGYNLHYGILSPAENTLRVGNTTSFILIGLVNNQLYQLAVSAFAVPTYFIAVTAKDNTGIAATPGIAHESAYSSEVQVVFTALPAESANSAIVTDFPEPITPNPNLSNNGCFIATAAYGHDSSPQVRALREFRDRYLLTNTPGKAFVRWYYTYGPIVADFLNAHPWLKPVARAALMPAVGMAVVVTGTSPLAKTVLFAILALFVFCVTLRFTKEKAERNRPRGHE